MRRSMSPPSGITVACCCTMYAQFLKVCQRCLLFSPSGCVLYYYEEKESERVKSLRHTRAHSSWLSCETRRQGMYGSERPPSRIEPYISLPCLPGSIGKQMPEPPQLSPITAEKQRLYSKETQFSFLCRCVVTQSS